MPYRTHPSRPPRTAHAFAWALTPALLFAGCVAPDGAREIDQERSAVSAVPDSAADPLVRVAFPPRQSATNQATIRIRGTARQGAGIVSITAGGVPAETQDGFASWSAQVPLELGVNTIEVVATIQRQTPKQFKVARLAVGRELELSWPEGLAVDADGHRVLVADYALRGLFAIDLETKVARVISSPERGTGPEPNGWYGVALDLDRNRALITDPMGPAVMAVDLATGDRSILASADTGTGPAFALPHRIAVDAEESRAFVTDPSLQAVIAIDLDTGARTVISDATSGAGPAFGSPSGLAHDALENRLLVTDTGLGAVLSVDLLTGDRTILSDDSLCSHCLDSARDIALDRANNRAVVLDSDWNHIVIAVDLDTGEQTFLGGASVGAGPFYNRVQALALDHAHDRILLSSPDTRSVIDLRPALEDLDDSPSVHLSRLDVGSGPRLLFAADGHIMASGGSSLLFEGERRALLAVSHVTGNRQVLAESPPEMGAAAGLALEGHDRVIIGDRAGDCELVRSFDLSSGESTVIGGSGAPGPCIEDMEDVAYDEAGRRVLVLTTELGVFAIDRDTGARTHLSGEGLGSGPTLQESIVLEVDAARHRVLVTDENIFGVMSVDLQGGNRELIFDDILLPVPPGDEESEEPEPAHLGLIAMDAARNQAVVVDRLWGVIYALDLATGTHTLLSGSYKGLGPQLSYVTSLFLDPARDYLMATDHQLGGLVAVDRVTGDRVVVSR
jgi:DNA-binding beta-propeller fold protein YncE